MRWPALFILSLLTLLTACDLQPVAAGEWDVLIDGPLGQFEQTWRIEEDGQLQIHTGPDTLATLAEMTGSRLSWSLAADGPEGASVNFSGTVDGDRLQGTLYSRQGNSTVSATRR